MRGQKEKEGEKGGKREGGGGEERERKEEGVPAAFGSLVFGAFSPSIPFDNIKPLRLNVFAFN